MIFSSLDLLKIIYSSYRLGDIQKYIINKQYIVYDLVGNYYNTTVTGIFAKTGTFFNINTGILWIDAVDINGNIIIFQAKLEQSVSQLIFILKKLYPVLTVLSETNAVYNLKTDSVNLPNVEVIYQNNQTQKYSATLILKSEPLTFMVTTAKKKIL